ncbi:small secreted protein [Streptomyces sp. B1866]|uniref:small secreted protein n=1 Tax=Streptomyces sp. B1866 TaxID=3075431 RepID=UPI00288F2370|nr:small secreted protein [Streptomyces sp. B1866]MDT3395171.1 small secreted protein [Streptomyces sp. B1866]
MNKKLVAALSGGAAVLLTLTGCDGGDGDKKADDWAKQVCDVVQPQSEKIRGASDSIRRAANEQDSEKLQQTDSAAFQQFSEAYAALAAAVEQAGPPPVKDGEKVRREVAAQLSQASNGYKGLKTTVDGLDTGNKARFASGLKGIADDLRELTKTADQALRRLQRGEAGEAMRKQPGCQAKSPAAAGT